MPSTSNMKISLSANVVLGGSIVPLSTDSLDLSNLSMEDLKKQLKSISFGLPANTSISANLGDVVAWIKKEATDFSLPPVITGLLGDAAQDLSKVAITINAFHITGAGHFDISLVIHFQGGLDSILGLPEQIKNWIDVDDIGFSFNYDKPTPPKT